MFALKKLLVPVDFSARSEAAAKHAAAMAAHFGAEVLFVHALPHGPYEHGLFDSAYNAGAVWPSPEEIELRVSGQLTEFVARVAPNVSTLTEVGFGSAAERIQAAAEREQVDLIVMPTHGYGPFRRFILGSVAAKVLHDVAFPVFTGAHVETIPEGEPSPYATVVCAIDLSLHSETVLRWAQGFAESFGAALHVVHAAPSVEGLPGIEEGHAPENLSEKLVSQRTERLTELLDSVGIDAEVHVDCAPVASFAVGVAESVRADLLVIGRSAGGHELGRLRSHSMELIRESPCPVVSV